MQIPVDLRSDTLTLPTPGMRKAMARAKVGDSRRGEDPSVRRLEETSAELFGKQAGLFLPSGTMANLCAVSAWTRPGDMVVASATSHIAGHESPGVALLASVAVVGIEAPGGILRAEEVAAAVGGLPGRAESKAGLVTVENTHNAAGGAVVPLAPLKEIRSLCAGLRIPLHVDGSRIFNAVVASGTAPETYGKASDSLMFCLSKGLGAPVGSVLVGTREFIAEARRIALRIGGGMRQAGIVAAGGAYALKHHIPRLAEDHENAAFLAEALGRIAGVEVGNDPVETNIVLFRWKTPSLDRAGFRERLAARGVALDDRAFPHFRAVTRLGIGKRDAARAARAIREVVGGGSRPKRP